MIENYKVPRFTGNYRPDKVAEDATTSDRSMKKHVIQHKHPRVNSMIEADMWFEPVLVIEVLGTEIILSPIHACAMDSIRKGSGLAIRFPRFSDNYRPEKALRTQQLLEKYWKCIVINSKRSAKLDQGRT